MEIEINLNSLDEAKNSLKSLQGTLDSLNDNKLFSDSKGETRSEIEKANKQLIEVKKSLSFLMEKSIAIVENTSVQVNAADEVMADAIRRAAEVANESLADFTING